MHTIEIPEIRKKLQMASCIEELQPADFMYLMQLVLLSKKGEITVDDFKTLLACRLLRVKKSRKYLLMKGVEKDTVHDNVNRISNLVDSFFVTETRNGEDVRVLNLDFIRQMIPHVGRYYGPADALTNCTYYEYKEAFSYFQQFNTDQDETDLNLMIAVLYRPRRRFLWIRRRMANFNGQDRIPFTSRTNPAKLLKRASRIAGWKYEVKTGIYLWLNSCITYLRTGSPVIDGNVVDLSILYKGGDEDTKPGIGLTGLLFSLAESHVFGTLPETSEANLYDIMARLYQLKLDYDNQLEKSRKK